MTVWITTNWGTFLEMGIPDHLTCLLRNLYVGQEVTLHRCDVIAVLDHELEIILTRLKTFLLIKIITITVNTFFPMRNKFVYSCSIKILSSGFDELLESIFCLLLVVEGFYLQKVVEMLEEMVVG